jgi:hypothetical protein
MQIRRVGLGIDAVVALCACGSAGPSGPLPANVAGNWTYTSATLGSQNAICDFYGTTLSLLQSGHGFHGSYVIPAPECIGATGMQVSPRITGTVHGSVAGSVMTFGFSGQSSGTSFTITSTGAVSGDTLSGASTMLVPVGSGVDTLTGTWTAVRVTTTP